MLEEIEKRINVLNGTIATDTSLGPQFCIGHSYVTPSNGIRMRDPREWFRNVVQTEIGPLLDEYWFDNHTEAESAKKKLLEGF